jgi:hypothetical protein
MPRNAKNDESGGTLYKEHKMKGKSTANIQRIDQKQQIVPLWEEYCEVILVILLRKQFYTIHSLP